jgi:hypothetical protein
MSERRKSPGGRQQSWEPQSRNYERTLCKFYLRGYCRREECTFAHGEDELRGPGPHPPGVLPPERSGPPESNRERRDGEHEEQLEREQGQGYNQEGIRVPRNREEDFAERTRAVAIARNQVFALAGTLGADLRKRNVVLTDTETLELVINFCGRLKDEFEKPGSEVP